MSRTAFEEHLAKNPRDYITRQIYADWLDENGEFEAADRQRSYQAAMEWMDNFASEHKNWYNEDHPDITAEELIQAGTDFVNSNGEDYYTQWGSESLRTFTTLADIKHFWKCWEIITGQKITESLEDLRPFSCSC